MTGTGLSPQVAWTTKSVTHGQCDARPAVTFLALEYHRPSTNTETKQHMKIYNSTQHDKPKQLNTINATS